MQTQEMAREKQINFRVSEEEARRFERVAEHHGIPVAAMLRMLVKKEERTILGAPVQWPSTSPMPAVPPAPHAVQLGELVIKREKKSTKRKGRR